MTVNMRPLITRFMFASMQSCRVNAVNALPLARRLTNRPMREPMKSEYSTVSESLVIMHYELLTAVPSVVPMLSEFALQQVFYTFGVRSMS